MADDEVVAALKFPFINHKHLVDDALDDAARRPAALVQRAHASKFAAAIYEDVAALREEPAEAPALGHEGA